MKRPFDHFDALARWYDRLLPRPADDPLLDLIEAEPGQGVLDIGGGTGRVSERLVRHGVTVFICDLSRQMVRQAHAKGLPAVLGSADGLPFASASVDRILVVDAFHHFTGSSAEMMQARAAGELLRVLVPDGRLVIEEPDIRRAAVKGIAWVERLLLMRSRFLPSSDIVALFEAAGARTLHSAENGPSVQLVFTKDI
jgi:SAM-dependent methyltransferase